MFRKWGELFKSKVEDDFNKDVGDPKLKKKQVKLEKK